jgi:hypothetical protein
MKKVIFRYKIIQPRKTFIRVKVSPCLHLQVESTVGKNVSFKECPNFPNIWESPKYTSRWKGDIKQFPY